MCGGSVWGYSGCVLRRGATCRCVCVQTNSRNEKPAEGSSRHFQRRTSRGSRYIYFSKSFLQHPPGLSKEAARRLFQPFSRSSSAAARGVPGVGLGLALSQRLSRSLGGRLSHDPTITDGAAFLLRLPLASFSEHKA